MIQLNHLIVFLTPVRILEKMIVLVVVLPVPKVALPEEERVVNAPDPCVVTPIVVKFPAAGVPVPIAAGAAQVDPRSEVESMVPDPV